MSSDKSVAFLLYYKQWSCSGHAITTGTLYVTLGSTQRTCQPTIQAKSRMDLFRLVCGLSLMRLVCGLSLMGLVLVLSDYYLDWKKRRALGDIPLILPNNPIHLWTGGKSAANYDDEMTRAYQQVGAALPQLVLLSFFHASSDSLRRVPAAVYKKGQALCPSQHERLEHHCSVPASALQGVVPHTDRPHKLAHTHYRGRGTRRSRGSRLV